MDELNLRTRCTQEVARFKDDQQGESLGHLSHEEMDMFLDRLPTPGLLLGARSVSVGADWHARMMALGCILDVKFPWLRVHLTDILSMFVAHQEGERNGCANLVGEIDKLAGPALKDKSAPRPKGALRRRAPPPPPQTHAYSSLRHPPVLSRPVVSCTLCTTRRASTKTPPARTPLWTRPWSASWGACQDRRTPPRRRR